MRTPEKIKRALLLCQSDICFDGNDTCPYRCEGNNACMSALAADAFDYIAQLEAWIDRVYKLAKGLPLPEPPKEDEA